MKRSEPNKLDELLHPVFDKKAVKQAKVWVAVFRLLRVLLPDRSYSSLMMLLNGMPMVKSVVMVRIETSPEDLAGMAVAEGILTARGGMTSHAAVVARGMGKCCVSGAGALNIDYKEHVL